MIQGHRRGGLAAVAALALTLAAHPLLADDGTNDAAKVELPKAHASATIPGTDSVIHAGAASQEATEILNKLSMMAFVDAETGALRPPTPAEVQQLAAAGRQLQALAAPMKLEAQEFTTSTGAVAAELPTELHAMSLVRLDEDGELVVGCSDAEAAHGTAVGPVTSQEEEE